MTATKKDAPVCCVVAQHYPRADPGLQHVVGKSIITNPGYFSSGRFLNREGVKRLLFSQLGSLVKG
jgi:hypothetical protein